MEKIEVISEQGYVREKTVTSPLPGDPMTPSKQQELERSCAYLQAQVIFLLAPHVIPKWLNVLTKN